MNFPEVVTFFNQGWVGLVVGLAGTIYFYYAGRRTPELSYVLRSTTVVHTGGSKDLQDQITVVYRGEPVPRLTATVLTIWNSGRGLLNRSDIAPKSPLRLVPGRVLEATLDYSEIASGCSMQVRNDELAGVHLAFDYLEPAQGLKLTVLHTGSLEDSTLMGSMKGIQIVNAESFTRRTLVSEIALMGSLMVATFGFLFFAANFSSGKYLGAALIGVAVAGVAFMAKLAHNSMTGANSPIPKRLR